jgi:hypothetical protein
MAELNYQINPDELEGDFDALPAGEYLAIIEDSDYTDNKAGTGKILKLAYQVIDGPMKGRKIYEYLNLQNANKQAEQISKKALNSIGIAVGVPHNDLKDSTLLHDTPMKLDVGVKEDPMYGRQNKIRKHIKIGESAINTPMEPVSNGNSTQEAKPVTAPEQTKQKPPWET